MSSIKEHTEVSCKYFGNDSLGNDFHKLLDESRFKLKKHHRKLDHDFDRLYRIAEEYGIQGYREILLHICMDYGMYQSAKEFSKKMVLAAIGEDEVKGFDVSTGKNNEQLQAILDDIEAGNAVLTFKE
jgi:hypothetical protein